MTHEGPVAGVDPAAFDLPNHLYDDLPAFPTLPAGPSVHEGRACSAFNVNRIIATRTLKLEIHDLILPFGYGKVNPYERSVSTGAAPVWVLCRSWIPGRQFRDRPDRQEGVGGPPHHEAVQ